MPNIFFHISKLVNYIYCLLAKSDKYILLNAWIDKPFREVKKRNFGDELNCYILKELTNKIIISSLNTYKAFRFNNLAFIGSVVDTFTNENTIIWGAGAIKGGKNPLSAHPKQVLAVRGKLTRQYLIDNGVDCPEVYGDPALLLPLIYNPKVPKKYKVGLIPHISDLTHPQARNLAQLKDVCLIRFDNYKDWHSVIDLILSCEMIISSSLHGLIISDAYHIPNIWAQFDNQIIGGTFKFFDYFSSVGREDKEPLIINHNVSVEELLESPHINYDICYDYNPLINSCPFNIRTYVK